MLSFTRFKHLGLIKDKLHTEHPYKGGTKVCVNDPGLMTKMTVNGKNIFLSKSGGPISTFNETLYVASGSLAHHGLY